MTGHDRSAQPAPTGLHFIANRNVPMNFQLGEWRVLSIPCPLAVFDCDRSPSFEELPPLAGAEGYLLKGIPTPLDAQLMEKRPGWLHRVLREYPRHLVDLSTGYEAYLGKFSGKTRSTLKRKLRKFLELSGGTIDWREYRTPAEINAFFPLAYELSSKTYQERLLGAGLPDTAAFREAAAEQAARGALCACILFLAGRPVSYLYLPIDGGRVIYAYLGYDPTVSEHSPGTVLQLLAMERFFADPALTVFDFTEGAGQHKQLFATHSEQFVDVIILKRSWRMSALSNAHQAFVRMEAGLSKSLESLGLKRRLKMLLRSLAPSRE
ncbi:MAG: GNAT family N-acetyltransferase [Alphaproteobacteria bacterium]|nr:GNAT family N-acetyltransferase [Alphaproteobacteria bacterium]